MKINIFCYEKYHFNIPVIFVDIYDLCQHPDSCQQPNCVYKISTDGGTFEVNAGQTAFVQSPYDLDGTPADGDFHVVKVVLGQEVIDVAEYGPFINTSTLSYSCNNNMPYTVRWNWSGLDVVVTIA